MEVFPNEDDPRPALRLAIEVRGGIPECRELHLISSDSGREIRRLDLRTIELERWLEYATLAVAQPVVEGHRESGRFVMTLDPSGLETYLQTVQSLRRGASRSGPGAAELQEAARVYQAAESKPTVAVAEKFGIKHRTASLWIKRAREAGYM